MAKKRRTHDEEAWTNATKICRLEVRQVEMARALGMNPRKLPGLRPSPQERWKLPVGEFIEQRYRKRFGGHPRDEDSRGPEARSRQPSTGVVAADLDADVSERVRDPVWQLSDLACYLVNLADDLQQWLAHGSIDPEVLPQVREELGEIARALDAGAPISPVPAIPVPSGSRRRVFSRRDDQERTVDDDEIPF
jgi:hypothetical protein